MTKLNPALIVFIFNLMLTSIGIGNAFGIELFGMVGSDYNIEPLAPWTSTWESYFAGGATFLMTSRFDAEFLFSKRADYNDIDRSHLQTDTGLTSLFGELDINLATRSNVKVFAFGGAGLLHYEQNGIMFNGPLPDDDFVTHETFNHLGVTTGIGTKFFFNEHIALRPELRFTFDTVDDFNSEGRNSVADIGKRFISVAIGIVLSP